MADIATLWDVQAGTGDWAIDPATSLIWTDENGNSVVDQAGAAIDASFGPGTGLTEGADLYTAVLISLFSDAEAGADDVLPDGAGNPRGWWAGPIGSKLWLRTRSKATATLPALIRHDIETALAWLIEDDVVASIDVTVEYERASMIGARVLFKRQDGARAALRFSRLWETI